MANDYDAPRRDTSGGDADDGLDTLKTMRRGNGSTTVDVDEAAEALDLPDGDLLDEELTVAVMPMQGDEFRCHRCFLVHHRSQLAARDGNRLTCRECA
jgi:hypothetical protein